jgi:DnaD/phage-associated family protein
MSEGKADYGNANIVRVRKDARYFVASNVPFNDKRLSWEARGVMGYLLSKPDNWQVSMVDLVNQSDAGMKVIRKVLAELRHSGYMSRERVTVAHGHFQWITTLYESPELNTSTILPSRIDGASIDGERVDIVSTELLSTEVTKKTIIASKIYKLYEQNIGMLTPLLSQEMTEYADLPSEWLENAFGEAVFANVRRWSYVKRCLDSWVSAGKITGKSGKTGKEPTPSATYTDYSALPADTTVYKPAPPKPASLQRIFDGR